MNKFLAMLMFSATLFVVACNNATEEAPAEEATTEEMPVEEVAPAADTTAAADTAAAPAQ
jgi:glutamate racemase